MINYKNTGSYLFFAIQIIVPSFSIYKYRQMKEEKRKSMLRQLLANNKNHPYNQYNKSISQNKKTQIINEQPQVIDKMTKSIKRIGTKQTIKSFHTNVDDNQQANKNKPEENFKFNTLAKSKSSHDNEYNHKQFKKKLKRVGKKVWVSAYKHNIDQKYEEESQNNLNYNLLTPNSPSDADYFSEFKQSSINVSSCSNKSKCVEVSDREDQDICQNYYDYNQDEKLTIQKTEQNQNNSYYREEQNQQNPKQSKKYIISVNKHLRQQPEFQKQKNQMKDKQFLFNFPTVGTNYRQQDENSIINIQQVLEQIQKSHSKKRKQSFEIKKCQSKKIIQIQSKKSIDSQKKRKSKINYQEFNKKLQEQMYRRQQKNQQSSSLKSSKKPLLPAYPFNNQKQTINIGQYIQKRSSNYRSKNLQLKKQISVDQPQNQIKKNEKDNIRQVTSQTPNRMIKSLNNSHHRKQAPNRKTLVQKLKTSQHTQMPKITTSIKKSIKYYQMNKYIIQARKQLGKQNYYI